MQQKLKKHKRAKPSHIGNNSQDESEGSDAEERGLVKALRSQQKELERLVTSTKSQQEQKLMSEN